MSTPFERVHPHGPITPLAPDVHYVTGSIKMAPPVRITRNMVVLHHAGALTLVNAVRLDTAGEAALTALGTVTNLVKLGIHGVDDAYYKHHFGARLWALPNAKLSEGVAADETLAPDHLPIPDAELFVFELTKQPEAALLLPGDGGLLITCDSVQNWVDTAGCSLVAKVATRVMGFVKPAQIGPPWRKMMTPEGGSLRPDFERLVQLPFDRLIGGHGAPMQSGAQAALRATITRVFGAA